MNQDSGLHGGDGQAAAAEGAIVSPAALDSDERRMHVRAYNHWVSLLGGRDYPAIADLDPEALGDFAANSVLLDFTAGNADPATPYIGSAIREECGLAGDIRSVAEAPPRSLLARLGGHYEQILAERAPVGFEAEFVNLRDQMICYRGMLMPFSSAGETIDFLYGVVNWKAAAGNHPAADGEVKPEDSIAPTTMPLWEDGPGASGEDHALDAARSALRAAAPLELDRLGGGEGEEFALVIARRTAGGGHDIVALIDDPGLLERALRQIG